MIDLQEIGASIGDGGAGDGGGKSALCAVIVIELDQGAAVRLKQAQLAV